MGVLKHISANDMAINEHLSNLFKKSANNTNKIGSLYNHDLLRPVLQVQSTHLSKAKKYLMFIGIVVGSMIIMSTICLIKNKIQIWQIARRFGRRSQTTHKRDGNIYIPMTEKKQIDKNLGLRKERRNAITEDSLKHLVEEVLKRDE